MLVNKKKCSTIFQVKNKLIYIWYAKLVYQIGLPNIYNFYLQTNIFETILLNT